MPETARFANDIPLGVTVQQLCDLVADDVVRNSDLDDLSSWDPTDNAHPDFIRGPEIPRIRPLLVALAARAVGPERADHDLQRTAEMLHTALRVHDLTLGREGGRRRRVARRIMRKSVSFLSGHHLSLRAMEIAQASRPEVLGALVETLRNFADGHALMAELQDGRIPTVDDWQEHTDTHTGALFAFCCRVGATAAPDPAHVEVLARYGRHLGRVWHIAEDLTLFAPPTRTGPDVEGFEEALVARALAGRPMLPVALAAERSPGVGRLWTQLVRHPSEATANWLATMVTDAGGLTAARERLLTESWHARRSVVQLPPSIYRGGLERLVREIATAHVRRG